MIAHKWLVVVNDVKKVEATAEITIYAESQREAEHDAKFEYERLFGVKAKVSSTIYLGKTRVQYMKDLKRIEG